MSQSATLVRPEALLKELGGLWTQLGKQESEGSDRSAGVLRAVTMTFVLCVEEGDDEAAAGEALAQLMHEHPSRAIVLKLRKQESAGLEGRAFAQCWMPFGRRQQICCEQIELSAGAAQFSDAVSLMDALVAPDLPVVVWCRSPHIYDLPSFSALARLAHKVILDSRDHGNPSAVFAWMLDRIHSGHLVGDLTWTRLTRWRETIATTFERMDCQNFLNSLVTIKISYSHTPEPVAVRYLAAWFGSLFGRRVQVETAYAPGSVSWQIREVRFQTPLAEDVVIERGEKAMVDTQIGEFHARTVFDALDEARLVREELAILGKDPVFTKVLEEIVHPRHHA